MGMPPERKKKALEALEKGKASGIFDKFSDYEKEQNRQWITEMELLERRVVSEYVDIELSDGQTIKLRSKLSAADTERLDRLRLLQSKIKDTHRQRELSYEIVEIITANPFLTKEYLKANPDKFSLDDIITIAFGQYEQQMKIQMERMRRIAAARDFRPEQKREDIC